MVTYLMSPFYSQTVKSLRDDQLLMEWAHTYTRTHHRRTLLDVNMEAEKKVEAIVGTLTNLGKCIPTVFNLIKAHKLHGGAQYGFYIGLSAIFQPLADRMKLKEHSVRNFVFFVSKILKVY